MPRVPSWGRRGGHWGSKAKGEEGVSQVPMREGEGAHAQPKPRTAPRGGRRGGGEGGGNANGSRGAVRARPLPAALQSAHTSARCAFRDILSGEAGPGLCASAVRGGAGPGKGGSWVGGGEGRGGGGGARGCFALPAACPAGCSQPRRLRRKRLRPGPGGGGAAPSPPREHRAPPPRTAPRSAAQRTARPERRTGCWRGSCGRAALRGGSGFVLIGSPSWSWFSSRL